MIYLILYFKTLEEIISLLRDEYSRESIAEAYMEIQELEKEGLIFSEEVDTSKIKYNNDNIVKALCLHVSHDCNLRCKYCFASQGDFKGERSMMSLEVGKRALEFLMRIQGTEGI